MFLSNHKFFCKSDKSLVDNDLLSCVSSHCDSKSRKSLKRFKLAEEQNYDEGRSDELET